MTPFKAINDGLAGTGTRGQVLYARRERDGKCIRCGRVSLTGKTCPECRTTMKDNAKKWYARKHPKQEVT